MYLAFKNIKESSKKGQHWSAKSKQQMMLLQVKMLEDKFF